MVWVVVFTGGSYHFGAHSHWWTHWWTRWWTHGSYWKEKTPSAWRAFYHATGQQDLKSNTLQCPGEPQKKNSYFPLYWLANRGPFIVPIYLGTIIPYIKQPTNMFFIAQVLFEPWGCQKVEPLWSHQSSLWNKPQKFWHRQPCNFLGARLFHRVFMLSHQYFNMFHLSIYIGQPQWHPPEFMSCCHAFRVFLATRNIGLQISRDTETSMSIPGDLMRRKPS